MLLNDLLQKVEYEKVIHERNAEIGGLSADSKHIMDGDMFICFKGGDSDGHDFAAEAVAAGAVAVVCERECDLPVCQIVVKNGRRAMSEFARAFYGNPAAKMKMIGITGTNGKTTTAHMLASILNKAGKNCALIGTLGVFYANREIAPALTTPDPIFLHKTFADMVECGVEYVVMEVSAHAVYFDKIEGIRFACCIFTNCTEDHLDFFKDMESYAAAKKSLFTPERCNLAIVNTDDAVGASLTGGKVRTYGYALENPADVFAIDVRESVRGSRFVLNLFDDLYEIDLHMTGKHNVYNAMAAAACAKLLGVGTEEIGKGLAALDKVNGRLEYVTAYRGADIFVDFAHTPDGLEKSLCALKPHCKGRLICVFGCGGNRDRQKRPIMGAAAGKLADFTVLTSDNPRYEDPFDIIVQIEEGLREHSKNYVIVADREKAIDYGINMLAKGDILFIAGKGGETYQEIMGVRHIYSDVSVIRSILREKTSGGEKREN